MSSIEWMSPVRYQDYHRLVETLREIANFEPGKQVPTAEVILLQNLARDALAGVDDSV